MADPISRPLFEGPYDLTPPSAEQMRVSPRQSVLLTTTIRAAELDGPVSARVRNVSAGGALVETQRPLWNGLAVVVALRGIGEVSGEVIWASDRRAGIRFNSPIDPDACRKPVTGGR